MRQNEERRVHEKVLSALEKMDIDERHRQQVAQENLRRIKKRLSDERFMQE
jgi:hypothetical protein